MSLSEAEKLNDILHEIERWSQAARLALVQRVLSTLTVEPLSEGTHQRRLGAARSLADLRGLLAIAKTPLNDAECQSILEEERLRKYGS